MIYVGINLNTNVGDWGWPIENLVVAETLDATQRRLEEADPSVGEWSSMEPQSYDYMALRDGGTAIIYEVDDGDG